MNADLHVHRFQARHRVSDGAGRKLALDAQAQLLDGELEAALARVSGRDELVLLRRLSARVRISSRRSDRDNARAWSDALALSLEQALRHGGGQDLLRFASPQHALRAFAADALHGRDTRDWAWQRLGLLPVRREGIHSGEQRRQALLRLIADDTEQGVPLLRCLFFSGLWPTLVAQLHEGELRGLALAVLARLAGSSGAAFADTPAAADARAAAAAAAPIRTSEDDADPTRARLLATRRAALGAAGARWALRLAAMLAAPALARRGAAAVDAQLRAWMADVGEAEPSADALPRIEPTAAPPAGRQSADPRQAASGRTQPNQAVDGDTAPRLSRDERMPDPGADDVHDTADAHANAEQSAANLPRQAEDTSGHTRLGGLLYLPPVLPLCGALALLEDETLWPSLPQALHQLALQLWPMAANDPAALAFCGLAPRQPPPATDLAPDQAPARKEALQRAQALLLDHLSARLPDWRGPALLSRVLCREARISADPGWIDVIYPLRDVSIELRRAAIDLDPGFLPWLGVVLRYRYE